MAGRSSSKLKTLYLWKILREESDERNPMTAQALCQALLKEYGLEAERKSIYTSLKALQDAGFQVEQASPASRGWYMDEHLFEEPELLLLVDAVQSANILNEQKSQDLVNRLLDSSLSGPSKVRFLERFNFSANGNRPENNRALYHIETISRAIDEKKKLQITYTRQTVDGKKSRIHVVSPYALIWIDNAFYLVCNNSAHDDFMHLRLDRIEKADVSEESARDCAEFSPIFKDGFDANVYRKGLFNAFSGDYENVVLECDDSLFSVIADRFGSSIHISRKGGDGRFQVTVRVMASDGFLRWVYQFGPEMTILEPASLRRELQKRAQAALARYAEES